MSKARSFYRPRFRACVAGAVASGLIAILAASPAWGQDRGGISPAPKPRPSIASAGVLQEASFWRVVEQRRVGPVTLQQKIDGPSLTVYTPPFGASAGPITFLRFVVLQQNGRNGGVLVTFEPSHGGSPGTFVLRRAVMAAFP